MADKHLSSQYDGELELLSSQILSLGGMVEAQIQRAAVAVAHMDSPACRQIVENELRIDRLEVEIDHDLLSVVARRQPTARDLRMLLAMSKITSNLERMGDEAERIARKVQSIAGEGAQRRPLPTGDLAVAGEMASRMLRHALDALARLDCAAAMQVLRADRALDAEFDGYVRKLITYMMGGPGMVRSGLDLLFIAKALERIGDHAKNLAELVIYVEKGTDVRHTPLDIVEDVVGAGRT
jgi:phosphate transport system protein